MSVAHGLLLALLFQSAALQDVRVFFGHSFSETVRLLEERGETVPARTPSDTNVLALDSRNIGARLLGEPSNNRLTARQINIVFCPKNDRVMALQLLIGAAAPLSRTDLLDAVQRTYDLRESLAFDTYRPAINYPLPGVTYTDDGQWHTAPGAEPVSIWNVGSSELVFQPITTSPAVNAQLWFSDKTAASDCAAAAVEK